MHEGKASVRERFDADPMPFLIAMRAMSRVFDGCKLEKAFSFCSQRRQQQHTCFATFDSVALRKVLHLGGTEHDKRRSKMKTIRQHARKMSIERRASIESMRRLDVKSQQFVARAPKGTNDRDVR